MDGMYRFVPYGDHRPYFVRVKSVPDGRGAARALSQLLKVEVSWIPSGASAQPA